MGLLGMTLARAALHKDRVKGPGPRGQGAARFRLLPLSRAGHLTSDTVRLGLGCSEHPTRLKTRRHHFSLFSEVTDTGSGSEVSELSLLKSSLCTTVTSLKVTESLVLVKPYRIWNLIPVG